MESKISWLELVLIVLSKSDINLLNEYNSTLTKKLDSPQKCSDEDWFYSLLIRGNCLQILELILASQQNIISKDSKKQKQLVALK